MQWKKADLARATLRMIFRVWLVFSAVAVLWAVASLIFIDFENPLRSDDPYVLGFFFGMVAVGACLVFTSADWFGRRKGLISFRDLAYSCAFIVWCLSLWLVARGGEGEGMAIFLAIGSAITGAVTWPLCRFRLSRSANSVITAGGILYVVLYSVVIVRRMLH